MVRGAGIAPAALALDLPPVSFGAECNHSLPQASQTDGDVGLQVRQQVEAISEQGSQAC